MIRFKQHLSEKASEIRSSDIMNSETVEEAYEKLNQLNPEKLGEGIFSAVFGGQGKLVVKLSDSGTDGTYWYLMEAKKRWMQNPHFPRVSFIKVLKPYGYIAVMEKLDFDRTNIARAFKIWDWHEDSYYATSIDNLSIVIRNLSISFINHKEKRGGTSDNNYLEFIDIFPKMAEIFELCYNLIKTKSIEFDLHGSNVASRNGTPVIVDPLGVSTIGYN